MSFALLLGATAPGHAFISGVWQGGPDTDEGGRFIDCTMTAQSGSGILLAFIISRERAWGLALADERWELNLGAVQDVELKIDSGPPVKAIAKVVDRHGILVPLANDDQLVTALRQGKLLTISTKTGTFSFELSGTSGALAALAACVAENLAAEKAKSASEIADKRPDEVAAVDPNPKAAGESQSQRLFTVGEASAFAAELLASAGVENYRLIDPAENPMPSFDVVFTYPNGIVGAIAGFKEGAAVDLDRAATTITADDAKNCRGSFSSGEKKSEGVDPTKVRRLFTACRSDGKLVEIHYMLIETDGGNLIEIAHLNRGDASLDIANADSAFLKAAALKNVK